MVVLWEGVWFWIVSEVGVPQRGPGWVLKELGTTLCRRGEELTCIRRNQKSPHLELEDRSLGGRLKADHTT